MISSKFTKIFLFILLVLWIGLFLAHPTNLTTTDLGRHLKNGELVLNGQNKVLHQNFYSYTNPDYEFINHHWGAGVIFFLIHSISGFKGLHLFYILLFILSFAFVFDLTRRLTNFNIAFISSLFFIPLITSRTAIRPEVFTYLLISIFLWLLIRYYKGNISSRWLMLLPALAILWVNTHIYFILGIFIILAFVVVDLVRKKITEKTKNLAKTAGFTFLASFLNPNLLEGVLYPFKIKANYGYRIFENQSVWFLDSLKSMNIGLLDYFKIISVIFVIGLVIYLLWEKRKEFPVILLSTTSLIFAWFMIRNITLFGFLGLPMFGLFSFSLAEYLRHKFNLDKLGRILLGAVSLTVFTAIFILSGTPNYSNSLKLGVLPTEASAEFFKDHNLQGPIFNNYDIGSFLIYHLFPEEKVFVDNRPETYPEKFFRDIYKPLQESESFWKNKSKDYDFNAIFFARHDFTPRAQEFLIERVKDPQWTPVFVDDYSIIFLKKNSKNEKIINRYELPKEMFIIKDSN